MWSHETLCRIYWKGADTLFNVEKVSFLRHVIVEEEKGDRGLPYYSTTMEFRIGNNNTRTCIGLNVADSQ